MSELLCGSGHLTDTAITAAEALWTEVIFAGIFRARHANVSRLLSTNCAGKYLSFGQRVVLLREVLG
jgi:hypothetical protein